MKASRFVFFIIYNWVDQIKGNEKIRVCSTHGERGLDKDVSIVKKKVKHHLM